MLWLLAALIAPASADSFDLANGSTIEGTLATYELGGNCQIFVSAGPVRGTTLLLPCSEIHAMRKAGAEPAAPVLEVEELTAPAAVVVPDPELQQAPSAVQMPAQDAPPAAQPSIMIIEEPPEATSPPPPPAEPAPVAASLPEGYAMPTPPPAPEEAVAEVEEPGPAPSNLRGVPHEAPVLAAPVAPSESTAAPAEEAVEAEPAPAPDGWNEKGNGPQLPRWLHKAIYGSEPAPADESSSGDSDS